MIDLFVSLLKLLRYRRLHIDGYVFRLHCTLTVLLLMGFCVLNSTKQIWGEPINCDVDKSIVSQKTIDSFCYITAIHSLPEMQSSGQTSVYWGLGLAKSPNIELKGNKRYNSYYQWVWFVLLFQAISFYFPRWLWKVCESNKMSSLVSDLSFFTTDEKIRDKKISLIVEFLYKTRTTNDWYAIKYFCCELLSFSNVFMQLLLTDWFLSGQFSTYGSDFFRYLMFDPSVQIDPTVKVFPLLCKCEFPRYGVSGMPESIDALCVLSINILNQKIFLFLWFWFYFLAFITSIVIIFRFILICCPVMRYYVCRYRFDLSNKCRNRNKQLIVRKLQIGDWFILYLLGQNIEPIIFGEIIELLCQKLNVGNDFTENIYPIENNDIQKDKDIHNDNSKM